MTRDEAISAGITPAPTKHNGHRRAYSHDYSRPGLYMLTMATQGRQRLFGTIAGHTRAPRGTEAFPHLQCSQLGAAVLTDEVRRISHHYPMVEVWKVALMPDHIHLLVYVRAQLPPGKHLGHVVRGFKTGCTRAWWRLLDQATPPTLPGGKAPGTTAPPAAAPVPAAPVPGVFPPGPPAPLPGASPLAAPVPGVFPPGPPAPVPAAPVPGAFPPDPPASPPGPAAPQRPVLFEAGYHDRIIHRPGMLENIKRYMDENPFRAKLREECPNIMQRRLHLWIHNREYAAFGNLFLLKQPSRIQVFFHRKDRQGRPTHLTPEYATARAALLRQAEEGSVLVTPGISQGEAGVVNAALDTHLPLIILQKEPITTYWKPPHRRFYACAEGHLLLLSPWQLEGDSDYARFHNLNDLAREICQATDTRIIGFQP